jgi:A/G-specific adenine glycosylase
MFDVWNRNFPSGHSQCNPYFTDVTLLLMRENRADFVLPFTAFVPGLLAWYDRYRRDLPFRINRTPYRVLVAEFMLQQTQTTVMQPYYDRFLKRWPTVQALSQATEEEVLAEWAGLGYYRRAVFLKQTADIIANELSGRVPAEPADLMKLPGIGAYTAGAVASIAYGIKVPAVDGNAVRVVARLTRRKLIAGESKTLKETAAYIAEGLPEERPGDVNEALMDLSASFCRPKKPDCMNCPLHNRCLSCRFNDAEKYPLKKRKKDVPVEKLTYVALIDGQKVLIRKRKENLLKDTCEFIRFDGHPEKHVILENLNTLSDENKGQANEILLSPLGQNKHVFSHRIWDVQFYLAQIPQDTSSYVKPANMPIISVNDEVTDISKDQSSDQNPAPYSCQDKEQNKDMEQNKIVKGQPGRLSEEICIGGRTYFAVEIRLLSEYPFSALFRSLIKQLEFMAEQDFSARQQS